MECILFLIYNMVFYMSYLETGKKSYIGVLIPTITNPIPFDGFIMNNSKCYNSFFLLFSFLLFPFYYFHYYVLFFFTFT